MNDPINTSSLFLSIHNWFSDEKILYGKDFGLGIDSFIFSLNNLLADCQMAPLYPANHYDWLILQSVRYLDEDVVKDPEYLMEHLAGFFEEILEFSFDEKEAVRQAELIKKL